jgi:hypothetical protein
MTHPAATAAIKQTLDQLNSSVDLAHAALAGIPRPQIPEEVFTVLFLPYFSGQVVPEGRNVMAEWISAAGSAMADVDVVDTDGNVVFTVPPIFSTDMLKLTRERPRGDFAEIVTETQMISHQSGVKATVYADQAINAKVRENVDQAKASQIRSTTEQRWGQIFDRYNIPRAPGAAPAKAEAKPLTDGGQDDLVYD